MTALISAPEVLILSLRKPEGKKCMQGEGSAALAAVCAPASERMRAAALVAQVAFCRRRRRDCVVSGMVMTSLRYLIA